ncbi:MAG: ATP-binding cassette domain-containing protein [Eubacteriales bacterium]|nr:ATP-binding cassette domain-containing protein [Eubacteriales bacterium]
MHEKAKKQMTAEQKRYLFLLAIIAGFLILFSVKIPNFVKLMTVTNLIRQSAVLMILAIGMTLVILTGGIDLSVGATMALSGACAAAVINSTGAETPGSAVLGMITAIAVGSLVGAANGYLCGYMRISPFMVTLAMQTFARGLTMMITDGSRIVVKNPVFNWLGGGQFHIGPLIVPNVTVILIPAVILALFWMKHSSTGIKIYSVGGNATAAYASGIHVKKETFKTYLTSGALCGLAAVITIGRSSSAQPLAGTGLEFDVITAVVMGGISLLGGVGTMAGIFLGSLLMGVLTLGINMINIPSYSNYIIQGVFVLVAVLSNQIVSLVKDAVNAGKNLKDSSANEKVLEAMSQSKVHRMEIKDITKSFSGVPALKGISMTVESGKVHALLGENGAGKSTLIKILSGVYQRDGGSITIDGMPVEIHSTVDSRKLGISVIYQEFALVPELNIVQNIFLGKEIQGKGRLLSVREMLKNAVNLMEQLHFNSNVTKKIRELSVSQQQMVEIAKAFSSNAWFVVMDEPTSAITEADKEKLFGIIREMKKQGIAVVYISHRMQEIFEIADEVTVLRDGAHVKTMPITETNEDDLTRLMVGREVKDIFNREKTKPGEVVFKVSDLERKGVFAPISFQVRAGEVLGFSGLMGAGRTEIARCIFGMDRHDGGEVWMKGEKLNIRSPKEALKHGICYVSEDRRGEGIIPLRSVRENICLAALEELCRKGYRNTGKEQALSSEYTEKFRIKAASQEQPIGRLSGGNQQKCCLAKMLACKPSLIILDEPTRGIDVGAKAEIHRLIGELAKQQIAIIMISSELPEILGCCDRIVVLAEGKRTGEFEGGKVTQEAVMECAMKI